MKPTIPVFACLAALCIVGITFGFAMPTFCELPPVGTWGRFGCILTAAVFLVCGLLAGVATVLNGRDLVRERRWQKATDDERLTMLHEAFPLRKPKITTIDIFRRVWRREMTPEEGATRLVEVDD